MEIFTAKRPTDEMFVGDLSLRKWAKESLSHEVIDIMDSNLLRGENRHLNSLKDCMSSIIILALDCSAELPEERKNMKDVLATLSKIKVKFRKEVQQT